MSKLFAIVWAVLASGCNRDTSAAERLPPATPTSGTCSAPDNAAHAELARLDTRSPNPLTPGMAWQAKQSMMAFLLAIQQVTEGAAAGDWQAVVRASATLGTSDETRPTCGHPPAGLDAIGAMALNFRCRADGIGVAARARDGAAVLRAIASTLAACNGCHALFRHQIVDEATWRAATEAQGSRR